ncbi:MAG: hypothetical protein ACYTEQ_06980 [Planctomycetota bacterium]|jgi:hypothetical protein
MSLRNIRKGSAFLMAIIVLAVLSSWAVSIFSVSGSNLQLAENQRKADGARACAESGHEIVRLWSGDVAIDGDTPPADRFGAIADGFVSEVSNISGIAAISETSPPRITVPSVTLDSSKGQTFSADITQLDSDTIQADITGAYGLVTKKIRVNYDYGVRIDTVFNFGVATRGPLSLAGNILLEGINVSVEADVYIESPGYDEALSIIGNSEIAGEVKITNPDAYVNLQGGQASIGGETGADALNHVETGYDPPEFPRPNPTYFLPWAVNDFDSSTDMTPTTFDNIHILGGTNPTFNSKTLRGVIFIEPPNIVSFGGDTTIIGIIVGNGDPAVDSPLNQIVFGGTVQSLPVTALPYESQFDGLHDETSTFILAPGFGLSFFGNFGTLGGCIAGNGITFTGDAGGTIEGTVINYSDQIPMELSGNNNLSFNRSGATEIPAGFVPQIVLHYDRDSYSEVAF